MIQLTEQQLALIIKEAHKEGQSLIGYIDVRKAEQYASKIVGLHLIRNNRFYKILEIMTPIELLKTELNSLEIAKYKSTLSCIMGEITIKLHSKHLKNLIPRIEMYERDINKLSIECQ